MAKKNLKLGWIGAGRMGFEMAQRLAKAGCDMTVWNRTRAKAEPLAKDGARIAGHLTEMAGCDIVFCMVSTLDDVKEVIHGPEGLLSGSRPGKGPAPRMLVECSSISLEGSAELRAFLARYGTQMLAAPVSGNAKVIKAGKLSFVCSGPKAAFDEVAPLLAHIGPAASYVGEGELARIVKICHNVMLGVVAQCMAEITVLAQKAGVPRHAFLDFINNSVMGSVFTRYKSPALVNCDWTPTFTPELLKKDLDLGLDAAHKLAVPVPVTAAAREVLQAHIGAARLKPDPEAYLALDFAALLETVALAAGMKVESENVPVASGLEA